LPTEVIYPILARSRFSPGFDLPTRTVVKMTTGSIAQQLEQVAEVHAAVARAGSIAVYRRSPHSSPRTLSADVAIIIKTGPQEGQAIGMPRKPRPATVTTLPLRGDHITLAQALKAAGLADTGGQAKLRVRYGEATVNGAVETKPGRKLHVGDRFALAGGPEWTITG
jgi:ribosome-associated protein